MFSRPVDSSGDILPVLSAADLLSGAEALAAGLRDHLNLFPGDWWEYADRGNEIIDLIILSRRTSRDAETLSSYLVSYIRSSPGIRSVSDVKASFQTYKFSFSCTAHTDSGQTLPLNFQTE